MRKRIILLGTLMLAFLAMAGMAKPGAAGASCDCNADTSSNRLVVH